MPDTDPTSTPATRTGAPSFSPAIFDRIVLMAYRCQKKPPSPLSKKISSVAIATAKIDTTPILSSVHANERVRGMS